MLLVLLDIFGSRDPGECCREHGCAVVTAQPLVIVPLLLVNISFEPGSNDSKSVVYLAQWSEVAVRIKEH